MRHALRLAVVLALVAPRARAEPPPRRVHLVVDGSCTDREDFWSRIRARTHVLSPAAPGEPAPTLTVTVAPSGDELIGTFRSQDDRDAPVVERVVAGRTCEEVASALSLVVALTYDRDAVLESPPPPPPPPPPTPPLPPAPTLPPSARPLTTPSVGAHATLSSIDALAGGGDAFVEVSRKWGALHPALRLSLALAYARKSTDQASATFVWAYAVPELCPTQLERGPVTFSPCAAFALGLLEATPSGIENATAFTRPWAAPRALVRSSYAASDRFGIELEAGLDVPLARDRFAFGTINAYRAPPLIPFVAVGFSYGWRSQ